MITFTQKLAENALRTLLGYFPSKSFRRIKVPRVLYDLSRGVENVMSRFLSHRDDISSSCRLPPFFFFGVSFFSLPLVSHCCFQIATLVSRMVLLQHRSEHYTPAPLYNGGATTEQWPPFLLPPAHVREE